MRTRDALMDELTRIAENDPELADEARDIMAETIEIEEQLRALGVIK